MKKPGAPSLFRQRPPTVLRTSYLLTRSARGGEQEGMVWGRNLIRLAGQALTGRDGDLDETKLTLNWFCAVVCSDPRNTTASAKV